MKIGVVIAAYNNWAALDLTLAGYAAQTRPADEVWVAEDSEFPEVRAVVARHAGVFGGRLHHLRQPNQGFGKWRIVNRAIAQSQADWLVFTDADCVPRADLLATYAARARPGQYLAAGSHVNLPPAFHATLDADAVRSQRIFDAAWLRAQGVAAPRLRLLPAGPLPRLLDALTPRDAFVGNNAGAWRADLLRVAGFDEAMGYGGADRNLGIRLNNAGVRGVRLRHSLICLHLDHARSYRHADQVAANKAFNAALAGTPEVLPRQSLLRADTAEAAR